MLTIEQPRQFFSKDHAERVAREMGEDDPDWTYTPVHPPDGKGWSFVEIRDEDGEFIGHVGHV